MERKQFVIDRMGRLFGETDVPIPPETHRAIALDLKEQGFKLHAMHFGKEVGGLRLIEGRVLVFTK